MQTQLWNSIQAGLIDKNIRSLEDQRPSLLLNNRNTKVINYIRKELENCTEFYFSVAFITDGGLSLLLHTLDILNQKGIKGKILTADYLNFNNPQVFKKLLKIPNIEVKINNNSNFHAKGYIFRHVEEYSVIIGSSNLTQAALTKNEEWNLRVTSTQNGQLIEDSLEEFFHAWDSAIDLSEEWIASYAETYNKTRRFSLSEDLLKEQAIKPNQMQIEALNNLASLRKKGIAKALLISATGTGKTYLSAFDIEKVKPKKVLFLAHRERLLKSSAKSFQKILGKHIDIGFYTSDKKDTNVQYLFASIATIGKQEHLEKFRTDEFDYIIIDEVHRAGAATYQRLLDYFHPQFMLGMTATPERTDDYNIFEFFNYQIAYEIRLQRALEEDMLCPFHYYGISEIEVNGELLSDISDFKYLMSENRVNHIIEKAEYYGYSGPRVKGLIFCSRNEEAQELSHQFNQKGYHTVALYGKDNDQVREDAITRLEQDEKDNSLDYIFTVDIFNEGIDIPAVNQVIMLRKTKSSIVFVQQLGRGLRKHKHKNYVVVLDFIGNYDHDFLIPVSLSGDRTYNKDNLRKFMNNANSIIPGCSSIEFDAVVKERIYKSINTANFGEAVFLKSEYTKLKNKIGHVPYHTDFLTYEAIDLQNIIQKYKSYINFLNVIEKGMFSYLSEDENKRIEFISRELSSGKRIEEIVILNMLLEKEKITIKEIKEKIFHVFQISSGEQTILSALSFLSGKFLNEKEWKNYQFCTFLDLKNGCYLPTEGFIQALQSEKFKDIVIDLLAYSEMNFKQKYSDYYRDTNFTLYEKYTRKDACRLLNWSVNEVPVNIGGYKYNESTNTLAVFVTYEKDEDISESIKYEDRFLNRNFIICISKPKRKLDSKDIKTIYKTPNIKIHLFIKRLKVEEEFYYMGLVDPYGEPELKYREHGDTVVEITYQLEQQVREDVYDFITG